MSVLAWCMCAIMISIPNGITRCRFCSLAYSSSRKDAIGFDYGIPKAVATSPTSKLTPNLNHLPGLSSSVLKCSKTVVELAPELVTTISTTWAAVVSEVCRVRFNNINSNWVWQCIENLNSFG